MGKTVHLIAAALVVAAAGTGPAYAQTPVQPTTPTWVTLGTGGGPVIRRLRSEPANALVVNGSVYLFDVGAGTERQLAGAHLRLRDVKAIFISHHHIDHNADLGQLIGSRWLFNGRAPLPIVGPPGTVRMVADLAGSIHPAELAPIGGDGTAPIRPAVASTVAARDLAATMDVPVEVYRDVNIRVLAVTNTHYHFASGSEPARLARSYSFRIEAPGRTIVYTGDTGPSAHVEMLAKNADLLVSEVIDLAGVTAAMKQAGDVPANAMAGMVAHMEQDHLTPEQVGKLAAAAGVKSVVLTHVVPGLDSETDPSVYTRGLKAVFKGPVAVARDLDRY